MVLPTRDLSGRRVILNQATGFDLDRHNNSNLMKVANNSNSNNYVFLKIHFLLPKVMVATLETLLEDEENQIRGMTYIINGKGIFIYNFENRFQINYCGKIGNYF